MTSISRQLEKKACFLVFAALFFLFSTHAGLGAEEGECPGLDLPPPPVLKVDLPELIATLEQLRDTRERLVWRTTPEAVRDLREIFESVPQKTKLEQFFQLLFLLQKNMEPRQFPVTVQPPGIVDALLAAKVFKNPDFPRKITSVELKKDSPRRPPLFKVIFSHQEVRFPINEGNGFSTWDQGMCQIARELVFYPGFSFRIRKARNSKNLVVDDFDKVEIFGKFGTRKIVSIDLSYVDLEKVEFIRGTDEGKVRARVSEREFRENEHSALFKFIGTLIPNTSKQRIDW